MSAQLRLLKHNELKVSEDPPSDTLDSEQADQRRREAYNAAVRWLAQREYSANELVTRLVRKGFEDADADYAVHLLQEHGLQSDLRFAEVFARSRINRGYGPMVVRQEMRERGLDEALIDGEITYDHQFWVNLATQAVDKRFKAQPDTREAWAKQARFLARRGFPSDLIYAALGDQRF